MDNMTAKFCLFVKAYHNKHTNFPIFQDEYAYDILGKDEYEMIKMNLIKGISFFNPSFKGNDEEALAWIVNNQLAPSVLARSAYAKSKYENMKLYDCDQYMIFASGYDTSGFNIKGMNVYELDYEDTIKDKIKRVKAANTNDNSIYIPCDLSSSKWTKIAIDKGLNINKKIFGTILGLIYYLDKNEFENLIKNISNICVEGSTICFDYPCTQDSENTSKNEMLASAANEKMKAKYDYQEIEQILDKYGFLIYEHLDEKEMEEQYFNTYNTINENNKMYPPKGVNYVLAVKKNLMR